MLESAHVALADIIRRRSRKAHYMAASSPGRMGIIRGIAAIAADYADTLPNAQRDAFLTACGHAAATVRGEYDKSPSFINHKASATDPGPLPAGPQANLCDIAGCVHVRREGRLFCDEHLAKHYASMVETCGLDAPAGNLAQPAMTGNTQRAAWNDYKEVDGPA